MKNDPFDQGARLAMARERRGFKTAKEATDYFGWNYVSYTQHESGQRGLSRSANKYAGPLRVSAAWLLTGEGEIDGKPNGVSVPKISWVAAGNFSDPAEGVQELAEAPHINVGDLPAKGEWIALEVVGDSMDRISPPESIIVVNLRDKRLVSNACYVIADENGAATYKRYRPDPDRFEPVSNAEHPTIYPPNVDLVPIIGRVRKTILNM